MLSRSWIVGIAAGLVALFAGLASAQDGPSQGIGEDQEAGQQAQEGRPGDSSLEDPVAPPVESPQTDLPADNPEQDDQATEQEQAPEPMLKWDAFVSAKDTLAQWLMAILGAIATVLSVVAVVLLKRNLDAARAAVEQAEAGTTAAKAGAEAAREANAIAQKVGEAQVRAYLSVSDFRIKFDGTMAIVLFKCRNTGNSPAQFVVSKFGMCVVDGPPKDFSYDYMDDIAPGDEDEYEVKLNEKFAVGRMTALLRADEFFMLFIDGEIAYRDVFGAEHKMLFQRCLFRTPGLSISVYRKAGRGPWTQPEYSAT